ERVFRNSRFVHLLHAIGSLIELKHFSPFGISQNNVARWRSHLFGDRVESLPSFLVRNSYRRSLRIARVRSRSYSLSVVPRTVDTYRVVSLARAPSSFFLFSYRVFSVRYRANVPSQLLANERVHVPRA